MDEKILIKSEVDKKYKETFRWLSIGLLCLCVLLFLILLSGFEVEHYRYGCENISGYKILFDFEEYENYDDIEDVFAMCMAYFIIACLAFVMGLSFLITFFAISKCELEITEKNARGKTFFGKQVVLPMYMISTYSTRKFLSTIAVATSSGITKFALVKNYAEIGNVLSQKINERQENTVQQSTVTAPAPQTSAMDELKKLKELLDSGIITQEDTLLFCSYRRLAQAP